jgi:hypothetical protein
MFSSPKGLMVVSIVKMSQEFKSEHLMSLSVAVFSESDILWGYRQKRKYPVNIMLIFLLPDSVKYIFTQTRRTRLLLVDNTIYLYNKSIYLENY